MAVVVIVGAQWGDEGKGKIVDLYAPSASTVVRYGGGANAGHTLVVGEEQVVFHLLPSGALHPHTTCVLGHGVVIDPEVLLRELSVLRAKGLLQTPRVKISGQAFLVLPHHKLVDELRESGAGAHAIGTTRRGIGPAYEDKVSRRGLRMWDLFSEQSFASKLERNLRAWRPTIEALGGQVPSTEDMVRQYRAYFQQLQDMIVDTGELVYEAAQRNEHVLLEGAQGTMLDLDHGTYPYVTSSSVVAAGACLGAGIGPSAITHVVGICKAYATRVGEGPFPTELSTAEQDVLREAGDEFGATTGRPRRCGWLDIPALRYAIRVNGIDSLALTKLDVLTGHDTIQVCVGYEIDGRRVASFPAHRLHEARPVYESLTGWQEPLDKCRAVQDLPASARRYVEAIEQWAGCPVSMIGVGPERDQSIVRYNPFHAR
jgi:adenylosuccinate synthase